MLGGSTKSGSLVGEDPAGCGLATVQSRPLGLWLSPGSQLLPGLAGLAGEGEPDTTATAPEPEARAAGRHTGGRKACPCSWKRSLSLKRSVNKHSTSSAARTSRASATKDAEMPRLQGAADSSTRQTDRKGAQRSSFARPHGSHQRAMRRFPGKDAHLSKPNRFRRKAWASAHVAKSAAIPDESEDVLRGGGPQERSGGPPRLHPCQPRGGLNQIST